MGNTPATCRPYLESMVGQPCDITRAQLAAYLVRYGIQVTQIGGELDQPVSRTDSTAATATNARYFVIHDMLPASFQSYFI